jgi:hypothetical protein
MGMREMRGMREIRKKLLTLPTPLTFHVMWKNKRET